MEKQPKILITLDTHVCTRRGVDFPGLQLKQAYANSVIKAGGLPLHIAPSDDQELIDGYLEIMDGLVISGGDFDIPPELYGKQADADRRIDAPKADRTNFEALLLRGALDRNIPILGICGGMQLLGVLLGASLIQDISSENKNALEHEQAHSPSESAHSVQLVANTRLADAVGCLQIEVNSTHHQALAGVPRDLRVEGRSLDGVIELVRHRHSPHVVGAQWHPELLSDRACEILYGDLIMDAVKYAENRSI